MRQPDHNSDIQSGSGTTCPRCHYTRHPDETAPDWRCPACSIAYRQNPFITSPAAQKHPARPTPPAGHQRRTAIAATLLIVCCGIIVLYLQQQALHIPDIYQIISNPQSPSKKKPSNTTSSDSIAHLAAQVEADDIVMYSTTHCRFCAQARAWLNQNSFTFTECNMSRNQQCEREFRQFGGRGVPYLVVYGTPLNSIGGFSPDELLAALRNPG